MTICIAKTIHALFPNCFIPARNLEKLKFNAGYVFYCELHISSLEVLINKDDVPHCLLHMDLLNF